MTPITLHLGLDVHKDSITRALAEPGPKGELRLFGILTPDLTTAVEVMAIRESRVQQPVLALRRAAL